MLLCFCAKLSAFSLYRQRSFSSLFASLIMWRPLAVCMPSRAFKGKLPYQTVFDLLSQRHGILNYFISNTINYFLAGEDQPQTNQPYD